MAANRSPQLLGTTASPSINDGTLVRSKSPAVGVIGNGVTQVGGLSRADVLLEVLRRTLRLVPTQVGGKLQSLMSPTALAVLVGSLAVWAASHAVGIGEAVDLLMLGVGFIFIGSEALDFLRHVGSFASLTLRARSESDLDDAARHLAAAIALLGVDMVVAVLFHGATKTCSSRYRPTVTPDPTLPPGAGETNAFGDVVYSTAGSTVDQELVRHHEMVHSFLSPKIRALRNQRATFGMKGYANSQLLRYIEEALAESYAQLRVNGFKGLPTGIRFPIANGYVTLRGVATEAAVAAGAMTVVIGGIHYAVTLEESK